MKFSPKLTQFMGVVNKANISCNYVNLSCFISNIIYIDNMTISKDKISYVFIDDFESDEGEFAWNIWIDKE